MSDIAINYKGSSIATMDASGTKTLLTSGKYCEDDIEIVYTQPSGGGDDGPLIIALEKDEHDIWTPADVTSAEIEAAFRSDKDIIVTIPYDQVYLYSYYSPLEQWLMYNVGNTNTPDVFVIDCYRFGNNQAVLTHSYIYDYREMVIPT